MSNIMHDTKLVVPQNLIYYHVKYEGVKTHTDDPVNVIT